MFVLKFLIHTYKFSKCLGTYIQFEIALGQGSCYGE